MTGLIAFLIVGLLAVIVVQIGKVSDLAAKIRGEEEVAQQSNDRTAVWCVIFMIAFLVLGTGSMYYYKDVMLGYGPHASASEHGGLIDGLFHATLIVTFIVFFITHVLLFWYAYKYRSREGNKAQFISHNNTIELVWTVIPAIVLTFLVVKGLVAWNNIMPDLGPEDQFLEIEATGYQFGWDIRHPGNDGKLGTKDYRLIRPGVNTLGIDWSDDKSMDDILLQDVIYLPVDTTVRVRITSKDVLHNFYLPHFRVKMDAIPGLPTYFIFKPTTTTEEYRQQLREYPEWNEPYDITDPESVPRWKAFEYELACAELCGTGHYSMRRILKIVSKEEYNDWLMGLESTYMTTVRGTDNDPRKGQLLDVEIKDRAVELKSDFQSALASENLLDKTIVLKHVFYNTGSAELSDLSKYELDNLTNIMKANSTVKVELAGHTDSEGDDATNLSLSQSRAQNVMNYLLNKGLNANRLTYTGFGETLPIGDNGNDAGREQNRRTELRIVSQ
ncbi:MAG: cytochrome c oxidase subunit 2 [Saprospiraceae bacterium]|jgi:cytochrome c oxidase subunit 2